MAFNEKNLMETYAKITDFEVINKLSNLLTSFEVNQKLLEPINEDLLEKNMNVLKN